MYKQLFDIAKNLVYEKKWNPQEVEFTYEGPEEKDFYILQTRDMVSTKRVAFEVFSPSAALQQSFIGKGIGVSGGALSGRAVFTLEDIHHLRREDPETPLILIRSDTVPEDVQEISMTEGLLTAKGGQTSHAAIVAFELDKTAVVGCRNLTVLENEGRCLINHTDGQKGRFHQPGRAKGAGLSGEARTAGGRRAVSSGSCKDAQTRRAQSIWKKGRAHASARIALDNASDFSPRRSHGIKTSTILTLY